jgi:hypothetical protein
LVVGHCGWMTTVSALEDMRLLAGFQLYLIVAQGPG